MDIRSRSETHSRRRRIVIASGVVAALGMGLWLAGRGGAHVSAAAPRPPAPVAELFPPVSAPPPVTTRRDPRADLAADFRAIPEPRPLAQLAVESYRERARYPGWSQPVLDGVDPIQRDWEVTPGLSMPEDERPRLRIRPARMSFEWPERVVVFASLEEEGRNLTPADLRGEVRDERGNEIAELDFRDDGRDGDERADDDLWTATLDSAGGGKSELKGAYLFEVTAQTGAGEPRSATSGFLYSVPLARLDGRFRERVIDGNLVIEAGVHVERSARFHLEGTLGTEEGHPLAWAQNALTLGPGDGWIPITFFGLALRESGRDGPYRLLSAALSTAGEMPNQKNVPLIDAYTTAFYRASEFRREPFDDPDLLEAAERLEREGTLDPRRFEVQGTP